MKKQLTFCLALLTILCTSAHAQLPSYLPADGLVGWWPFNGNANDESGNGNDGVVNGATLTEDRFGNANAAFNFLNNDTSLSEIILDDVPALSNQDWSISFWINTSNSLRQGIITLGNDNVTRDCIQIFSIEQLQYNLHNVTGPFTSGGIADANWHHVTVMNFDGNGHLYFDGVFHGSTPGMNPNIGVSGTRRFGGARNIDGNIWRMNGSLDDITIYNRALTSEEVTQLYAVQSTGDPTAGGGGNTTGPLANVPRGISYQAVARDAQGQAIASSPVNVRFTLHQGTPTGATEFSETHSLTTNEIGLFNTYFGSGTAITSAFDSIVWSNTTKFLQVEIDLGNGYVDMGTQQLMSVPYAYRANEAAAAGTIRNNALPVYPDNTAALAGGLVAGEMYRTATGDLKVVY